MYLFNPDPKKLLYLFGRYPVVALDPNFPIGPQVAAMVTYALEEIREKWDWATIQEQETFRTAVARVGGRRLDVPIPFRLIASDGLGGLVVVNNSSNQWHTAPIESMVKPRRHTYPLLVSKTRDFQEA